MPPGLQIVNNTHISGRVPDVDALYSFTIRATNVYDKYADMVFRMQIIGKTLQLIKSDTPASVLFLSYSWSLKV